MKHIPFEQLPGFSRLFLDFWQGNPFFEEVFPFNKKLFSDSSGLMERASGFKQRVMLRDVIKNSSAINSNSPQKKINLEALVESNSLAVVTGQQVGFLGGPIYTFLKAMSAVRLAEKLTGIHSGLRFVPVFWIEDNDHDNLESSQTFLFSQDSQIYQTGCEPNATKDDRTAVSELIFNDNINDIISNIITTLPQGQFIDEISLLIKQNFQSGKCWTDAFIEFLEEILGDTGILFIKASVARRHGLFAEIIQKEISSLGCSDDLIQQTNKKLEQAGYHIQARSSRINLFYHENKKREKIIPLDLSMSRFRAGDSILTKEELNDLAQSHPELFSPKVLLRPICQDCALPTAAYIGGPSEIGYSAQIRCLYEYFSIPMPAFLMRHSATLITKKLKRILENTRKPPLFYFRKQNEIELDLLNQGDGIEIENLFTDAKRETASIFNRISAHLISNDSLIRSSQATEHKSLELLAHLEKKVISANKKSQSELYEKAIQAASMIYPLRSLQERIFSPVSFIAQCGLEKFRVVLNKITNETPDRHYLADLFEE